MRKLRSLLFLPFAPILYLLFRVSKQKGLIDLCLSCDPRYAHALDSRYAHKSGRGPALLQLSQAFELAANLPPDLTPKIKELLPRSRSQLLQDVLAVLLTGEKRDGYFVEVGVGDGEFLSNTFLLESDYGWSGLLVEPNRSFHASIADKRRATLIEAAAYSESGLTLMFEAMSEGEFSRIAVEGVSRPGLAVNETYKVPTRTLNDMLVEVGAPKTIDYISIDTEGSEFDVLRGLDLSRWAVSVFSVEHNFEPVKSRRINELLTRHGYRLILLGASKYDFFYVHPTVMSQLGSCI